MSIIHYFNPKYLFYSINNYFDSLRYKIKVVGTSSIKNCKFEGNNLVNSAILKNCVIGEGTYISGNTRLVDAQIGKYCSIGPNVVNGLGSHPSKVFVSTHPAFYSLKRQAGFTFVEKQLFQEAVFIDNKFRIKIGNDVWIGKDVKIMDGIQIHDGVIIAAGSIVTKDVEAYSVVGGVPAKFIRKRFSDSEIATLMEFKWWNMHSDWLKLHSSYFTNIKSFIKLIEMQNIN